MKAKSESESKILSFINEVVNKTGKCPAVIHTDRGGEFNSNYFRSALDKLGITVEAGPAESPQTNGLAKRFNQTLLVKMRCLLAQSSVPINYWDEAARYASTLINILPSKALNWSSPVNVLSELNLLIKTVRDINKMVPFGLKVYVSHKPPSKISAPSRPLICLGYEPNSDALRFFDSTRRHVVISRDYKPSKLSFPYNSPHSLTKPPDTLPRAVHDKSSQEFASIRVAPVKLNMLPDRPPQSGASTPPRPPSATPAPHRSLSPVEPVCSPPRVASAAAPPFPAPPQPTRAAAVQPSASRHAPKLAKHWTYVPADTRPSKEITSNIVPTNIVAGSRRATARPREPAAIPSAVEDPPESLMLLQFDLPEYMFLTETVTVREAMNNTAECQGWEEAMAKEFHSLDDKNTGTLVPPPGDDKVIGGMWLLTRKKNEFGDLLRYKTRWVFFGNHQVHMLHYFDTYASVARNESFKLLISIAVNRRWAVFQFDVETAFLYGEIDAPVYVSQVEGFEQPGKESWVWRLNKSLYGTKQAP